MATCLFASWLQETAAAPVEKQIADTLVLHAEGRLTGDHSEKAAAGEVTGTAAGEADPVLLMIKA